MQREEQETTLLMAVEPILAEAQTTPNLSNSEWSIVVEE